MCVGVYILEASIVTGVCVYFRSFSSTKFLYVFFKSSLVLLTPKGKHIPQAPSQGSEIFVEEGEERGQEPEVVNDSRETSFGHSMTVAQEPTGIHGMDKPVRAHTRLNPSKERHGSCTIPPQAMGLLAIVSY